MPSKNKLFFFNLGKEKDKNSIEKVAKDMNIDEFIKST